MHEIQASLEMSKRTRWIDIKLLMATIVIAAIAAVAIIYFSTDQVDLSSEERSYIADACGRCHRHPERLDHNASKVHSIHMSADCMTCHVGADGLETADNAHDIIEWVGIGIAGATVAGLGANFLVAKRRIGEKR